MSGPPVAALLGTFMAKHRALVPQPLQATEQTPLDPRPYAAGGTFRPERQAVAVTVEKGIHFLLDNVRSLTDGAAEQFRFLYNRQADLSVPICRENVTHDAFQPLPVRRLIRKNVAHPPDCLNLRCQRNYPNRVQRPRRGPSPTGSQVCTVALLGCYFAEGEAGHIPPSEWGGIKRFAIVLNLDIPGIAK